MTSKYADALLEAQKKELPQILKKMTDPKVYKKKRHWIWWVCPTAVIGRNDPYKSGIKDENDLLLVLRNTRTRKLWTKILKFLTQAMKHNGKSVFPESDHGRIKGFCNEMYNRFIIYEDYKVFSKYVLKFIQQVDKWYRV